MKSGLARASVAKLRNLSVKLKPVPSVVNACFASGADDSATFAGPGKFNRDIAASRRCARGRWRAKEERKAWCRCQDRDTCGAVSHARQNHSLF